MNSPQLKIRIMTLTKQISQVMKKPSLLCCPVNHEYSRKKKQIEKKRIQLYKVRTGLRSMMSEEHLNALSLVYIPRDILLNYDKIVDIYASKYPRRILLINPLSES